MLSSVKNYAVVSEQISEDMNGSEENHDESNDDNCRKSSLTNALLSHDVHCTQTDAQVTCSEVSKLPSDIEEALQEDYEETSSNTAVEEDTDHNETGDDETDDSFNMTSVAEVSLEVVEASTDASVFPRGKTSQECPASSDSSENLLGSNNAEDSDEVFPLVKQKANSAEDLLDKNFVKWANEGNLLRSNRDKDSAQSSESPSSDVEFSACSSVTSCTEDSGISSIVRDEELEEIPLNNSQFSPELYKQMSRFSMDDSVAAWIPKSSNTYAPSPNSNAKIVSVTDGGKSQKQSKLKGLFSRSSQKEPVPAWKLFGKVPIKDVRESSKDLHNQPSSFDRGDSKRRSFGDRPLSITPNLKPKFLSVRKKPTAGSSTTALIFENRPSNLPAKSPTEEKKHRRQYEAMVAEAKKKELKEMKLQEKKLKEKCKQEDGIVSAVSLWTNEILPNWETMQHAKKTRDLWWQGLPPSVRGTVWKLAIGNDLHITHELFDIFQSHAYEKLFTTRLNKKKNPTQTVAELPASDHPVVSKAHTVELIMMDVSRTFPSLCIFQEGGPFHDVLHSILGAYTCYRPDVGYVSYLPLLSPTSAQLLWGWWKYSK